MARTIAVTCLTVYTSWKIYSSLVLKTLGDALSEFDPEEEVVVEEEAGEGDGNRLLFFIPFPGTTTEIEGERYTKNSPEWGEFLHFATSPDHVKRIKGLRSSS